MLEFQNEEHPLYVPNEFELAQELQQVKIEAEAWRKKYQTLLTEVTKLRAEVYEHVCILDMLKHVIKFAFPGKWR